ncbi:MAG: DUF2934 domain-containing protein [Chlorobium phaeobacteroides]|uniref:DUF2934 domain-containing protein n=1 Tax=Chlorobium phaeobacteroides (strain BS1) TaxID=331678 RepID=B3EJ03_CHLPB|nr:DUF2934 domain-containing protein [Chlorobium phaeobacteroides]MBL6956460.1 DUF2934 domain-containing protein [Chlorobium phaeobacteroides]NEX14811.1 DUF2934 domain-containing protein [Prosthecochloris sp.]
MSDKQKSVEKDEVTQEQREEQVRLAAYYLWKENGEPQGTDLDDWLHAETALVAEGEEVAAE